MNINLSFILYKDILCKMPTSTPFDNKFGIEIPFANTNYFIGFISNDDYKSILELLKITKIVEKKAYHLIDIGFDMKLNCVYNELSSLKTKMPSKIIYNLLKLNFSKRILIHIKFIDGKIVFDSDTLFSKSLKLNIITNLLEIDSSIRNIINIKNYLE